jgi:hypothetical protein
MRCRDTAANHPLFKYRQRLSGHYTIRLADGLLYLELRDALDAAGFGVLDTLSISTRATPSLPARLAAARHAGGAATDTKTRSTGWRHLADNMGQPPKYPTPGPHRPGLLRVRKG